MKEYFEKLYRYDNWANERIADFLLYNENDDETLKLFSHILNAKFIWATRITKTSLGPNVWDVYLPEQLQQQVRDSTLLFEGIIKKLTLETEFALPVSYVTTEGKPYTTLLSDILAHIVNHSSYHRGQIAKLIRLKGFAPVNTDYITFCRQG